MGSYSYSNLALKHTNKKQKLYRLIFLYTEGIINAININQGSMSKIPSVMLEKTVA